MLEMKSRPPLLEKKKTKKKNKRTTWSKFPGIEAVQIIGSLLIKILSRIDSYL